MMQVTILRVFIKLIELLDVLEDSPLIRSLSVSLIFFFFFLVVVFAFGFFFSVLYFFSSILEKKSKNNVFLEIRFCNKYKNKRKDYVNGSIA